MNLCSNLTEEKSCVSMFEFPTSIPMNTGSMLKEVWYLSNDCVMVCITDIFVPIVDGVYQHIKFLRFIKDTKEEITGLLSHHLIAHIH